MKWVWQAGMLSLAILFAGQAVAEVPQVISYQGKISVAGKAFNGSGQFKFALVNSGGENLWTNDGAATGTNNAPGTAINLTVAQGVYSVLLGDARLGMPPIDPAIFVNSAVSVRTWFSDGSHGMQLLTPDFPLTSVPYAMVAAKVPCKSITPCNLDAGTVKGKIIDCTGSAPLADTFVFAEGTSAISIASEAAPHNYELTYVPAGTRNVVAWLPTGRDSRTLDVNAGDLLTNIDFYVGGSSFYADADGDGLGDPDSSQAACGPIAGYVANANDCNDTSATIGAPSPCTVPNAVGACSQGQACPGEQCVGPEPQPEVCDGIDNNCNGQIDEGVKLTFYFDADGDRYGDPSSAITACVPPPGYVANADDCDDTRGDVAPGMPEMCDGMDNDCDGMVDEDFPGLAINCVAGVGACERSGKLVCSPDGTSVVCNIEPGQPQTEICDGVDNDCDGMVDNGFQLGESCSVGYGNCRNGRHLRVRRKR